MSLPGRREAHVPPRLVSISATCQIVIPSPRCAGSLPETTARYVVVRILTAAPFLRDSFQKRWVRLPDQRTLIQLRQRRF